MEPIIDGVIRELDAYQIYNIVSFEVDEKDFQVKTILAKSRGEFWDKALSGGLIFEGCLVNIKKQIEKLLRQLNKRSYTYKTSYENEIEIYFQYIANINLNINDTNEVIFMKILSELIMNQNFGANLSSAERRFNPNSHNVPEINKIQPNSILV